MQQIIGALQPEACMPGRDIVVIGGSAGALEALHELLGELPRGTEAALFVAVHRRLHRDSNLEPMRRLARMPLHFALDGERIARGRAYFCPSDHHLLVERARVRVDTSPAENLFRPSIDALFRSAAQAYGRRVVGVLLSGLLRDGTAGLWQIKKRGGVAIVQDPQSAKFPDMPRHARDSMPVDYCLPPAMIARAIAALAAGEPQPVPADARRARVLIVEDERIVAKNLERRLAELGYEVSGSAASGEEAIELCARAHPDVVLMDIHLAGALEGTEAARRVWERFQIPVVYVTAYSDTATLDEAKITEPYGYVVKPFRPEQIHAALQLALERRSREAG
jgi:chemotaxis response regulator CheB